MTIDAGPLAEDASEGASVAVDGVCLTVCGIEGSCLDFDVITETLSRSTLGRRRVNDRVNLERSLRAGDRIDGHFVQGHVEGTAKVARRKVSDGQWVLWFQPAAEVIRYMIPKGSVAVSGVSLTIAAVQDSEFSVALIPTTLSRTTLIDLRVGDMVNVESDILARTIVHALEGIGQTAGLTLTDVPLVKGLTEAKLREHGYL